MTRFQYETWSAFSAVCRAAEEAFPDVPVATWGSPEWHKLPRWEYGEPVGELDLSPIAWIERHYQLEHPIPHGHILSVGLSNLYDMSLKTTSEAAADPKMRSGTGIELSLRVGLKDGTDLDPWMPAWAINLLRDLVGYQLSGASFFWYGSYSQDPDPNSKIPGLAFTFDESFEQIRSASGTIDIIQIILLTRDEADLCAEQKTSRHFLEVFEKIYPDAVNVIGRPSILDTPANRARIVELAAEATTEAADGA